MLYLDYARRAGEWVPNRVRRTGKPRGDRISSRMLNEQAYAQHPGAVMIAEESTSWPGGQPSGLCRRARLRPQMGHGLDARHAATTSALDPVHRRYHHRNLTFGMLYAWSENFVLPISHDEVVHGKRSLLAKMPGDRWQQVCEPALALWIHVGALRQEAHLHGQRVWPMARMESRREPRLASTRNTTSIADCSAWCAISIDSIARSPRYRKPTSSRRAFDGSTPNNADDNVIMFMRIAPSSGRTHHLRVQLFAGGAHRLSHRRAARRFLSRDAQYRFRNFMAAVISATAAASIHSRSNGSAIRSRSRRRCRHWQWCGSRLRTRSRLMSF